MLALVLFIQLFLLIDNFLLARFFFWARCQFLLNSLLSGFQYVVVNNLKNSTSLYIFFYSLLLPFYFSFLVYIHLKVFYFSSFFLSFLLPFYSLYLQHVKSTTWYYESLKFIIVLTLIFSGWRSCQPQSKDSVYTASFRQERVSVCQ